MHVLTKEFLTVKVTITCTVPVPVTVKVTKSSALLSHLPFRFLFVSIVFFFVRYSTVVPISIIIFARNIKKNKRKTKRERHKSSDIEIEKANRITLQNFRKNFKSHWIRHFWQMILHLTDGYAPCMNAWILDFHSIVSFDFFFNCIRLFRWLIFVLSHHIAMKTFVLLFCI